MYCTVCVSGQSSSHSEHVQSALETAVQTCKLMLVLRPNFQKCICTCISGQHTSLQTQEVEGSMRSHNPAQSTQQVPFYGLYKTSTCVAIKCMQVLPPFSHCALCNYYLPNVGEHPSHEGRVSTFPDQTTYPVSHSSEYTTYIHV